MGSHRSSVFDFWRTCQTFPHQWKRFPFSQQEKCSFSSTSSLALTVVLITTACREHVRWYRSVVLTYVSPVTVDVERLLMCISAL